MQKWLAKRPRFHMHFTPTSASWLSMRERFFRDITVERLRRGVFTSVPELVTAIHEHLAHHNSDPKPFIWTKSARDILQKVILRLRPSILRLHCPGKVLAVTMNSCRAELFIPMSTSKTLKESAKDKVKDVGKELLKEAARKAGATEAQICEAEHCAAAGASRMSACLMTYSMEVIGPDEIRA